MDRVMNEPGGVEDRNRSEIPLDQFEGPDGERYEQALVIDTPALTLGEAWSMVEQMRANGWTVTLVVRDDVLTPDYRVRVQGPKTKHGRWIVNGHAQGERTAGIAIRQAYEIAKQTAENWNHVAQPPRKTEMLRGEVMPDDQRVEPIPPHTPDATPGDPVRSEPPEVARVIEEAEKLANKARAYLNEPFSEPERDLDEAVVLLNRLERKSRPLLAALREAEERRKGNLELLYKSQDRVLELRRALRRSTEDEP